MAYITRIIGKDEKLIGIARLHWIYVVMGLLWFIVLAYLGAESERLILTMIMYLESAVMAVNAPYITSLFAYVFAGLISFANYVNIIQAGIGACIFIASIIKVMVTEIGLTTRRVIYKKGWLAVNIKQIDLEEIRGENIDYGGFGRFLGYGHIRLDCRFIGDVKLPSIAHPENFMKALHQYRATTQDAVSVMVGKGTPTPIEVVAQRPDIPEEPTAVQVSPDLPVTIVSRAPAQVETKADVEVISEVVAQVVPKIVKEMVKEGVVTPPQAAEAPEHSEEELQGAFDDAAFQTSARSVKEPSKKRA